jgi:cell division protein FtsB
LAVELTRRAAAAGVLLLPPAAAAGVVCHPQLQKKRLNSQNDDKKTERDKLFAEHRQLKDGIRGPSNLAVRACGCVEDAGGGGFCCCSLRTHSGPRCSPTTPRLPHRRHTLRAVPQAVEESIARMEYELTHESMSAEREKMVREKKERAEKNDRPAAMRLAQVCWVSKGTAAGRGVACVSCSLLLPAHRVPHLPPLLPPPPPFPQLSAKIDEAKAASDAIRADIAVLNTRLDSIKAAREVEEKKLQDMRSAQQEARSDIPALNVEKKELWEVRAWVWGWWWWWGHP